MINIKRFEKLYAITKDGKVWSYRRNKFLKLGYDKGGYAKVYLYPKSEYGEGSIKINGKYKRIRRIFSIHRLVAQVYLKNYSEKLEVNHKDFNKLNNNVKNLEMLTPQENWNHAFKNNKFDNLFKKASKISYKRRKLSYNDANNIRKLYKFRKITSINLAKKYNVSASAIKNIIHDRTYLK